MHKKDSVISICHRSMLPSLVSRPAASALPGTLLKRQILCHIPDLLNGNLWELAQSSPFYQSFPSDSDAPQHSRVTITEHLPKATNHENPETQSTSLEAILIGSRESSWLCVPICFTLTFQGHTQPENRPWKV